MQSAVFLTVNKCELHLKKLNCHSQIATKSDDVVDSVPSPVNSFLILTEVLHIRMSTTLKVYPVWHSGTVLMFTQMLSALSGPLC
jgi:hypothetical protein